MLGQNVSAYHGQNDVDGEATLGGLIKLLHTIDGIKRIRYTTSHPNDMLSSDLLLSHTELEKLMPYIHLPVQSGSDAILKAMNRKHNVEFYLELIAKFKSVRADIAFSSDFIVGYPGETDQDFNDTLALVEYVQYSQAYSFKYSQRPGTPASMLNNQISEEVKNERLQKLQNLLAQQQTAFNQQKVGMTMQILLEKPGKYEGQLIGKSPYMQSTVIQNPNYQIGDMPSVIITKATQNSLYGEVINS